MDDTNKGTGIVLNRMYVGDYLASNLGHEIINMYQADNGGNYIYLNSSGDFVKAHQGQIGYMLFVKYYGIGEVEVFGMATGLKDVYCADQQFTGKYKGVNKEIFDRQQQYAKAEGGISYGGISIFDIFGESGQQSVFITYKADKVYIPVEGKRMFIRFHVADTTKYPVHKSGDIVVTLQGYQQAKASLKQYIYPDGTHSGDLAKQDVEKKREDYARIRSMLIDNLSLWQETNNRVDDEELDCVNERKVTLFDICQIQNDENKFSNALAYFMLQYRALWSEFFERYNLDLGDNFVVTREESSKIEDSKYNHKKFPSGGRIDLFVRTNNNLVIIENKIKSDINSIDEDCEGKQLRRYYNYAVWLSKNKECDDYGKVPRFFILTPKYNIPVIEDAEMRELYTIVTYADVYEYLTAKRAEFAGDGNFVAFFEAMYRHTHNNVNGYLYHEMQETFFRRIKDLL